MSNGRISAAAAVFLTLATVAASSRAQGPGSGAPGGAPVRVEARFVDPASGLDAGWGATGQILIAPLPGDPALLRWQQVRSVATSQTSQRITLDPGGRGLIRVGRGIPFAGWFFRHGIRCGLLERGSEWREVESGLEVELEAFETDGAVRLSLTPEFSYLSGRSRATVPFAGERAAITLAPGAEARFAPAPELAAFYGRLLAGYDPLRRVWPVELILRVDLVETPEP